MNNSGNIRRGVGGIGSLLKDLGHNAVVHVRGDSKYINVVESGRTVSISFNPDQLASQLGTTFIARLDEHPSIGEPHAIYGFSEWRYDQNGNLVQAQGGRTQAIAGNPANEINGRKFIPVGTYVDMTEETQDDGSVVYWFDITAGYDSTPVDMTIEDDWDIEDQPAGKFGVTSKNVTEIVDGSSSVDIYTRQYTWDSNGNLTTIGEKELVVSIQKEEVTVVTNVYWDATLGQLIQTQCDITVLDVGGCGDFKIFDSTVCDDTVV